MDAKRLALILVCLLPACLPGPSSKNPPNEVLDISHEATAMRTETTQAEDEDTVPLTPEIEELIETYLTLRPVLGQFNGGTWNEAVDSWVGRKHTAMLELAAALSGRDFSCTQLTQLLQQPDHTVQGGDPLHDLIQTLPAYDTGPEEDTNFLVYEWRGTHDFLFFVCEDGRITGSDWWYAGE